VNRAVAVQVTDPHPLSQSKEPVITLYKWWPGNSAKFNIPTPAQWETIRNIIDTEFGPLLKWTTGATAAKKLKSAVGDGDLTKLSRQHPERFAKLIETLTVHLDGAPSEEDADLFAAIADLVSQFDKASIARVTHILNTLKEGDTATVTDIDEAFTDWSAVQVAAVLRETRRRLATIELLRESISDEKTFEIRGDNSIHSILERDLWLLDESYWMIQSNQTLKTFIGDKLSEKDAKKYGKKRPDFACGAIGNKLILVELKRPSHSLTKEDLNQIEEYLAISEKYSQSFRYFDTYLLGSEISDEVRTYLKYRRGVTVQSYWEILDNTEKRYKIFLKSHAKGA
jgi:hypothetical protein